MEVDGMKLFCQGCGKSFEGKGTDRYCSEECKDKTRSERKASQRNIIHWEREPRNCLYCKQTFYPEHRSDQVYCSEQCREKAKWERKKPVPIERACPNCGTAFVPMKGQQKCCSKECTDEKYYRVNREKIRERTKQYRLSHLEQERDRKRRDRENNKEHYQQRDFEYHDITRFGGNKQAVLERDGYKCTVCGADVGLSVHHKDFSGQSEKPNNDPSNLITVCKSCHTEIHKPTRWKEIRHQTVYCQTCGKEMTVINARIADNRGKYCSKECADKAKITKAETVCQHCSKTFKVQPARLKRGKVKYCSMECRKAAGYSTRKPK
jgi:hypothetical protein